MKIAFLGLSGALFPLPQTPNFRWSVQWHLWVYKFETCFGALLTTLKLPCDGQKKIPIFFFLAQAIDDSIIIYNPCNIQCEFTCPTTFEAFKVVLPIDRQGPRLSIRIVIWILSSGTLFGDHQYFSSHHIIFPKSETVSCLGG